MKIFYEFSDFDLQTEIPNSFRKYFSESWGKVKTSNYCGAIKIGDETIAILPKIDKADDNANMRYLVYMLSFVYDLRVDETTSSTDTEQSPIIELLISVFCRDLLFEAEPLDEYLPQTIKDINTKIKEKLSDDYLIGYTFFIDKNKSKIEDDERSAHIYKYKIKPLIEEYFYADEQIKTEIFGVLDI